MEEEDLGNKTESKKRKAIRTNVKITPPRDMEDAIRKKTYKRGAIRTKPKVSLSTFRMQINKIPEFAKR